MNKKYIVPLLLGIYYTLASVCPLYALPLIHTPLPSTEKVEKDSTLDYVLKQSSKASSVLFNQGQLHLYQGDTYLESFSYQKNRLTQYYDTNRETEVQEYNSVGFPKIPVTHVSNINQSMHYVDQYHTGVYANNNCGPAVVEMAFSWALPENKLTAADFRNRYRSVGGWFYTSDIEKIFSDYRINYQTKILETESELMHFIDKGGIAILCIDTRVIPYTSYWNSRIGLYYDGSGGHFVLVTGYLKMDNLIYFELYDPNSWGESKFIDNRPSGEGVYLKASELLRSVNARWPYAIVVNGQEN